jgi:cyclopropane-fatty-acyl-phospholipid synthase
MVKERVLETLIEGINRHSDKVIGVRLPDGTQIPDSAQIVVHFHTDSSLKRTLRDPEMGFGEGYMTGSITVEGDLEELLRAGSLLLSELQGRGTFNAFLFKLLNNVAIINRGREAKNVQHHYDLGDDFYSLWLDESRTYSCAFFSSPDMSLEEAQREKRRIIYEKLRLTEGDTLLDIGCGWGSIILECAQIYGIRTFGITLSENQFRYIQEQISNRGLEELVTVRLMHYADLQKLNMKFTKVVSVGMFEHVGRDHLKTFFTCVNSVLEEGGLFLLHTIGKVHPQKQSRWIRKYIFPGGYLPSIPEIITAFSHTDFCLIDIDDWRIHYYKTLKEWRRRFRSHIDEIREKYGDVFVRMWDLYLTSSAVSFFIGSNHLFQFLLSKGVKNDYPVMKREFLGSPALT